MNFIAPENRKYKVFIDFDGTITEKDVGEHMFLRFGDAEEANNIIKRWMNKEINSTESWVLLCNTIKSFDEKKFEEFLNEIEISPGFDDFIEYCQINKIETYVLSDGLDYYIKYILRKFGYEHLKLFSNKLSIKDNKLVPSFPYGDEECTRCANCKRNHILNNSSDDDYTIYIGDGYSDTCPAQFVDYIFAKNSLLKFCEKERISYFPFKNFYNVKSKVDELRSKKRLRKRHQAFLKRKEVYQLG
jgi:2-hydroxy-3-keto-5-methylthiopentenyl-1-phosphate phosphatase